MNGHSEQSKHMQNPSNTVLSKMTDCSEPTEWEFYGPHVSRYLIQQIYEQEWKGKPTELQQSVPQA